MITYRSAARADAPTLLALYAQMDGADDAACSEAVIDRFFARLAQYPDYQVYLAERDGAVIGTYALLIMDNLGHGGTPLAIVESVMVDSATRGSGIGRQLMADARQRAAAAGCYKLMLSSNDKRTDAHAFYDGLGFKRHGVSFMVQP